MTLQYNEGRMVGYYESSFGTQINVKQIEILRLLKGEWSNFCSDEQRLVYLDDNNKCGHENEKRSFSCCTRDDV